jgi:hypothetical protein
LSGPIDLQKSSRPALPLKNLAALWILLGFTGVARAAVVLPRVDVQDPTSCTTAAVVQQELTALLAPNRDHHASTVVVVVALVDGRDNGDRTVQLTLLDGPAAKVVLERSLVIQDVECPDAARLVARIVAPMLVEAPGLPAGSPVVGNTAGNTTATKERPGPVDPRHLWLLTPFELADSVSFSNARLPCQGPEKTRITWEQFYRAVDRPDLAQSYKTRGTIKTALFASGGLSAGALALLVLLGFVSSPLAVYAVIFGVTATVLVGASALLVLVGVGVAVGLAALAVLAVLATLAITLLALGFGLAQHQLDEPERMQLAEEHNAGLR